MHMRMKCKVLTISVQNAHYTWRATQIFCVHTQFQDGIGAGFKKQIEQQSSIAHNDTSERLWQRKHQMRIRRSQQFSRAILQRLFSFESTTIGTMAVATTVVLVVLMPATCATIQMHTQACCMAIC